MKLFVSEKAKGAQLKSPEEIAKSCKSIARADQEVFMLLGFNGQLIENHREVLFKGGLGSCHIDLRILFRHLLIAGSSSFVVVHNHPSGIDKPSQEDDNLTRKIKEAAKLLGIKFNDHVIVYDGGHYSYSVDGKL